MADPTAAPQPGTPEYDAAMAAKVEESAAAAKAAGDPNPPAASTEGVATEGETKGASEGAEEDAGKKAAEDAGIDYTKLQAEFDKDGGLSDESFASLEKAGFPRDVVNEFIAGQEARSELRLIKAAEAAGGKDALDQMQTWAAKAMSPQEIETFNKAVSGSDKDMLEAISGLKSRYETTYGKPPALLGGSPAGSQVGYASKAEMTSDMRDPRYAKDPAFRSKVEAKLAATTSF